MIFFAAFGYVLGVISGVTVTVWKLTSIKRRK